MKAQAQIEIIKHGKPRGYGFRLEYDEVTKNGVRLEDDECVVWSDKAPAPWSGQTWQGEIVSFPKSGYYRNRINVFFPKCLVSDIANETLGVEVSRICQRPIRVVVADGNIRLIWVRGFKDGIQHPKFGQAKKGTPTEVGAAVGSMVTAREFAMVINKEFGEDVCQELLSLFGISGGSPVDLDAIVAKFT